MCLLLCEHGIACALRWGVTIVKVILIRHCSPHRGIPFPMQGLHRWTTLRQGRDCEEGRHVALINFFVRSA